MTDKTSDAIKLNLRLPKPLHKRLKQQARRNNVSLNTEIINQLEGAVAATAKRMAEALRPALDHAIAEAIEKATGRSQSRKLEMILSMILAGAGVRRAPRTEEELEALLRQQGAPDDEAEEMMEMFREIQAGTRVPWTWGRPEQK
jgi:hypothetical protein